MAATEVAINTKRLVSHRYALFVSYLGTRYRGSQRVIARDKHGIQDSIQESIEWSLAKFMPTKEARLTASSRTDTGVHALMNCYTLPLMECKIPTEEMKRMANSHLIRRKHDIMINEVLLVPNDFHPRKRALSREYIYRIVVLNNYKDRYFSLTHRPEELFCHLPVTELYKVLPLPCFDLERARQFIDLVKGEHDFASFSHSTKKPENTVRVLELDIRPGQQNSLEPRNHSPFTFYDLHFKSRAFLYNQIRRTVGALISFASYQFCEIDEIQNLLDKPSCDNWGPKLLVAEPWGLYLSRINYPKSAFGGTAKKTFKDGPEEKVESFFGIEDASDDLTDCENEEPLN